MIKYCLGCCEENPYQEKRGTKHVSSCSGACEWVRIRCTDTRGCINRTALSGRYIVTHNHQNQNKIIWDRGTLDYAESDYFPAFLYPFLPKQRYLNASSDIAELKDLQWDQLFWCYIMSVFTDQFTSSVVSVSSPQLTSSNTSIP